MYDMKQAHGIGPLYAVHHRQRPGHRIARGWLREIEPPFRWGRGIELFLCGHTFGVGLCRRRKFVDEYTATREALNGHELIEKPSVIGDW